mgnify:CR=1 FL=1
MAVNARQRRKVVLIGLTSEIEWQCAHNMVEQAEKNKRIVITYGTQDVDLTLAVQTVGKEKVVVTKAKEEGH